MITREEIPVIRTPLFIVLEGIDGSGKSTQAALLHEYFLEQNIDAVMLFEPTNGIWGRKIRKMLKSDSAPDPEKQSELFIRDRMDDVKVNILPSLAENKTVIMDRYYFSNAAYQGAGGLPPEAILTENRNNNCPEPDRVYFIDIPPEVAIERIASRSSESPDLFEKLNFLQRVRDLFLTFENINFVVIDGNRNQHDVFHDIVNDIIQTFKQ